jgi:hypothetical protein
MPRFTLQILAGAILLGGFGFAVIRPKPAIAQATHDVYVVNPPKSPVPVAVVGGNEPFHLTAQLSFDGGSDRGRAELITATRRMIVEHVSGRLNTNQNQQANFSLELEAPGRKTVALHEVPLTRAWLIPDDWEVDDSQRQLLIASQPMRFVIEPGQTLYWAVQEISAEPVLQIAALTVSGVYADAP